jgi:hypothetical protein
MVCPRNRSPIDILYEMPYSHSIRRWPNPNCYKAWASPRSPMAHATQKRGRCFPLCTAWNKPDGRPPNGAIGDQAPLEILSSEAQGPRPAPVRIAALGAHFAGDGQCSRSHIGGSHAGQLLSKPPPQEAD